MENWGGKPLRVSVLVCFLVVPLLALAQENSVRSQITDVIDESKLVVLKGNTHPLARPEFDRGGAPASLPMRRMLLVLKRSPEQEAALQKLLDDQQDKSSPTYHQWLTPEQFGQQFGPSDQDLHSVTSWLQSHGFEIGRAAQGRGVIEFSGSASQVQEAFHTSIHKYVVKGEEHWSNASDPQIPAALASVVAGVNTLHNFYKKPQYRKLGAFTRSNATGEVKPLFTFPGSHGNVYGLGPTDFANIYNVPSSFDGTGQTIAIVGDSNINLNDIQSFRNMFGLPSNPPNIILNGPDPGINPDETEADLDVEWSGAVAKNATIDFVVSENTEATAGIDLSALYIIDNNLAAVMSESFGACEAVMGSTGNAFYNAAWAQAAAQGITVIVSSGDSGSAGCDDPNTEKQAQFGLAVNGIASTPFNVALGGTDFDQAGIQASYWNPTNVPPTQSSAKSYIPETVWNDSCGQLSAGCIGASSSLLNIVAGSGGPSSLHAKPSWQSGTGVPADGARDLPDVSLFSSNGFNLSFYIVCQSDQTPSFSCDLNSPFTDFIGVGGTSAAAPTFAGIMALVNQKTGSRQGQANYVLYPLSKKSGASCKSSASPGSSCIFYDVVKGNNAVPCVAGSLNCSSSGLIVNSSNSPAWTATTGYDLATGLGSVNVTNLVNNWSSVGFTATTTTISSIAPTTLTHGQPVNLTITVAPSAATGRVSLVGSNGTGIDGFALSGGTAMGTTSLLPGGSYTVKAHYPGDGVYATSDSTPVSVTVGKENSNTLIRLVTFDALGNPNYNATTTPYGSPYLLRVDITNAAAAFCAPNPTGEAGCATGSVDLTDNGGQLDKGTFTLNSAGYLEDQLIQLPPGTHNVQAQYAGDNSFNASSSSATFTITQAATTNTLQASATNILPGVSVTLTATITTSSNGTPPTGTVTFSSGSTQLGVVSVTGSINSKGLAQATAALSTTQLPKGTDNVTAAYSGDTNYVASTSPAVVITVSTSPDFTLPTSLSAVTIASPGMSGTTTLTTTALNGFNSAISFSCNGLPNETACTFSPASLTGSGTTTITVTTTAPRSALLKRTGTPLWAMIIGQSTLGCVFLLGARARRRGWIRLMGWLAFVCLLGVVGCGGGGSHGTSDPGTPLGTSTVTVTSTSGSLSHNVTFTLTVQ